MDNGFMFRKFLMFIIICQLSLVGLAANEIEVQGVEIIGASKTSKPWLKKFLSLHFPAQFSESRLNAIKIKLQSTLVFSSVGVYVDKNALGRRILYIDIEEKWTRIPVIRGAVGGGVPLRVVGVYDSHYAGQLYTLGAQMMQYDSQKPGGVIWVRAPKYNGGSEELGAEVWSENRKRSIYGQSRNETGSLYTNSQYIRAYYLLPFKSDLPVKYGVDLTYKKFEVDSVNDSNSDLDHRFIDLTTTEKAYYSLKLPLRYDAIDVDQLHMDGLKSTFTIGYQSSELGEDPFIEFDGFYYKRLDQYSELAMHIFIGSHSLKNLSNTYFLSGLDSVRGLDDSSLYGNKSVYTNIEWRSLGFKSRYVWLQSVLFSDYGQAGSSFLDDKFFQAAYSYGVGIRISFPKIYRLVVRIDYGKTEGDIQSQGITAGLNQLFQPYKPL